MYPFLENLGIVVDKASLMFSNLKMVLYQCKELKVLTKIGVVLVLDLTWQSESVADVI